MAISVIKDANRIPGLLGASSSDGTTPTAVYVDPSTHRLYVDANVSSATVVGAKSNNGGAPGSTNLGVLPAVANAAAPSYTETNQVALSTDLAGALRVTGSLSVGGTTDNSAYTAGSSTGTPAMGFYHSAIDTVTDGRAASVAITPKRAMMVNLQTAAGVELTNTSNALDINIKSGNLTTLPVTNAGTFAVQDTVMDAAIIAQEATTSGVKGITAFGAVTTAKPTYTTAKSDALSLDVNGLLRVSLADTPANGTKLLVTPDSVALPANQSVNVSQMNGVTTSMGSGIMGTGVQRVAIASDNDAVTVKQATGTNLHTVLDANSGVDIGKLTANQSVNVAQINGVTALMGNGVTGTGSQRVTIASDNTANSNPFLVTQTPATTGGLTFSTNSIKATATSIKASAGQVFGWYIYNANAVVSYVQFFNTASGSVTLGTTPPVYSIGIPPSSAANVFTDTGIAHSTAIVVAATTTVSGNTAPTSNVDINIFYK